MKHQSPPRTSDFDQLKVGDRVEICRHGEGTILHVHPAGIIGRRARYDAEYDATRTNTKAFGAGFWEQDLRKFEA